VLGRPLYLVGRVVSRAAAPAPSAPIAAADA
jgi:hypothetical protein